MAETTFTLRNPPYSYLHLRMTEQAQNGTFKKSNEQNELDDIMLISHLTGALHQYLGLMGAAIALDILKVEKSEGWVRLPSEEESAVIAALSQWIGKGGVSLKILGRGSWLGGLRSDTDDAKLWSLEA